VRQRVLEPRPVCPARSFKQPEQAHGQVLAQPFHRAVTLKRAQILVDAEQRVRPRARAAELRHGGEGLVKQISRQTLGAWIAGASDDGAKGPEGAAMTVFRALGLEPLARIGEKVSESLRRAIERVIDEGEIPGRESANGGEVVAP